MRDHYITRIQNKLILYGAWFFSLAMCFMSPIIGLTLSLLAFILSNTTKYIYLISPALSFSIFLSLINSQKMIEGDLIAYLSYFKNLEYLSLGEVFLQYITEPFFYMLAWFLGNIFSFSDLVFKFSFSFIGYFALLFSVQKIMIDFEYAANKIFIGILLVALSTVIFSNSLHLVRQFVSLGFFMVAISANRVSSRNLFFLISAMLHISSFILIALYVLARSKNMGKFIFAFGLFSYEKIVTSIVPIAISLGIAPLAYFGLRISAESFHEMPGISIFSFFFIIATAFYIFLVRMLESMDANESLSIKAKNKILNFYDFNIYLGLLVLFIQFALEANEPASRMMVGYVLFTMISVGFSLKFIKLQPFSAWVLSLVLVTFYVLNIFNGTWSYANIDKTIACYLVCSFL